MTSNKSKWLRARHPEQIEERRNCILDAASALLVEQGLEGTGINAIARQADISKANIYRYFESREAILLHLLMKEHERWMKALQRRLKKLSGSQDEEQIVKAITASLAKRPTYCLLVGSLANVLEQNVSTETIREFKRELQGLAAPVCLSLQQAHSGLTPDVGQNFLAILSMSAAGIWPHCNPSPAVREVLAEHEFAPFRFTFQSTLLLSGLGLMRQMLDS